MMHIIQFNGLGQPNDGKTKSGDLLILVQSGEVSIVQLKLLPPEEYGPELLPVGYSEAILDQVKELIKQIHPTCLTSDRHWTLACPPEIAKLLII